MNNEDRKIAHRLYMREWRKKNPEKERRYKKNWIANNPEKNREHSRRARTMWRKLNPEENKSQLRRYRQEHARQERTRSAGWRKRNPEKVRAEKLFQYQVRVGNIAKEEICSICGLTNKIESHHPDYSKPYNVVWTCRSCHVWLNRPKNFEVEP